MAYDTHFLREDVVDVTAAVIGIRKDKWVSLNKEEANEEKALEIAEQWRFDIIPIVSESGVKEFFQTDNLNDYSSMSRKQITDGDLIYFRTPLENLIYQLASKSRFFFFLTNNIEVIGLVSIVHLSARQVKVYLFNLLSELEIRLSNFLSDKVTDRELLQMKFETSDEDNGNSYEKVKDNYKQGKSNGVDAAFTEYLYLSHFIRIIRKRGLHKDLGYSGKQFDKLGSLNDLRNLVAHPNRSIITKPDSVEKLWRRIVRIEEAVDKLKNLQRAER